jgi:hypothetical protein
MRGLVLAALVLALALPASASAATPAEVLRDCTDNGRLDKTYTLAELVAGFRSITADQAAYSSCGAILSAAIQARGDVLDCSDFTAQQDAQVFLTPGDPSRLDPDRNGIACDALPSRTDVPPSTPGSAGTPLPGQPGAPPGGGGSGPGGIVLPNNEAAVTRPVVGRKGDRTRACGNFNVKRKRFVKTVRRATALNVTVRNVKCRVAARLVVKLKTFKKGKRRALGFTCRAKTAGAKNRKTIRCTKPRRKLVTWLVRV